MGIPTSLVISFTFMLGSALAGAAGVLVGLTYPKIDPLMGVMFGLKAFVAAVLGGVGNVVGAVFGALLLGLAEEMEVALSGLHVICCGLQSVSSSEKLQTKKTNYYLT
jgi:branched-chain amino acid transport system permease protein